MPARHKRYTPRRVKKNKDKKRVNLKLFRIIFFSVIILGVIIYITFNTKYWVNDNKLNVVTPIGDSVNIYIFDPNAEKITTLTIPGNTEVESARNLGLFKIKNVWQLGVNEKAQGILMAETVTKNFKIPVTAWAEEGFSGFNKGKSLHLFRSLLTPYKTNMTFADKLRLFIFAFRLSEFKYEEEDLSQSGLLINSELPDGGEGYKISSKMPDDLIVLASDNYFIKSPTMVAIYNATGGNSVVEKYAEIINSMGGKVVKVSKVDLGDYDCNVAGKDKKKIERLELIFKCKDVSGKSYSGNFDLEVTLGERFAERF